MIGRWRMANGYFANIEGTDGTLWFGVIEIRVGMDWLEIPSFWNSKGDSERSEWNLKERRREDEGFRD